jgi:hypothetical protein
MLNAQSFDFRFWHLADIKRLTADFRYWHKADVPPASRDFRFRALNGHQMSAFPRSSVRDAVVVARCWPPTKRNVPLASRTP